VLPNRAPNQVSVDPHPHAEHSEPHWHGLRFLARPTKTGATANGGGIDGADNVMRSDRTREFPSSPAPRTGSCTQCGQRLLLDAQR
jgi:hypothetical protein